VGISNSYLKFARNSAMAASHTQAHETEGKLSALSSQMFDISVLVDVVRVRRFYTAKCRRDCLENLSRTTQFWDLTKRVGSAVSFLNAMMKMQRQAGKG
jgi:hypothetical protein